MLISKTKSKIATCNLFDSKRRIYHLLNEQADGIQMYQIYVSNRILISNNNEMMMRIYEYNDDFKPDQR
jgi:hypothetical protein